jgi:hypothetical protein
MNFVLQRGVRGSLYQCMYLVSEIKKLAKKTGYIYLLFVFYITHSKHLLSHSHSTTSNRGFKIPATDNVKRSRCMVLTWQVAREDFIYIHPIVRAVLAL